MPTYNVYDLMSSAATYSHSFSGEDLTPEEAVISAYYDDNKDSINEPLIDYVKNNIKNVRNNVSRINGCTYYLYNDYGTYVKKT